MASLKLPPKSALTSKPSAKPRIVKPPKLTKHDTPDPLAGLPDLGSVEENAKAEDSALLQAFRAQARKEEKDRDTRADPEYWFAVCFQTRDQKDAFLQAVGWGHLGDKYIDGQELADLLSVDLVPADIHYTVNRKIDKDLAKLAE